MLSPQDDNVQPLLPPGRARNATSIPSDSGRRSATPFHLRSGHIPGEPGVWVFIVGDMVIFGLFFITFAVYRASSLQLYEQSQQAMSQTFGVINTVILLTSSWLVGLAGESAKRGMNRTSRRLFAGAVLCGVMFITVKLLEYHEKIQAGITLNTNEFFSFYYMLTGIHLLHVVIGICVLAYLLKLVGSRTVALNINALEGGAAFWHLVDILWIVLFALFYLMR